MSRLLTRDHLFVAVSLAFTMPAHSAWAQSQADSAPHASATVTQLDAVSVTAPTGSRIMREGYDAPTPFTVARADDLLLTAPSSIPDALNKLPQFSFSSGPSRTLHNFPNTAAHGNILNLRGVGGGRSLILFDGIRVAPTTFLGEVDVDVLPSALMQQVDVVTAGASAAYGSDAVAGVVNFILDKGFIGTKGSVQYGVSERGDNAARRATAAFGKSMLQGSAHFLLSAEYLKTDGMLRSDRKISERRYNYVGKNPGAGPAGTAANPYVLGENVLIGSATDGGLIRGGALGGYKFLPDGSITLAEVGTPTGTAGFTYGGDGYSIPRNVTSVSPQEMKRAFARYSYDFASGMSAHVQAVFSKNELSYSALANSFVAPTSARCGLDNPFLKLTPAQRGMLEAAGEDNIQVATYSSYMPNPLAIEQGQYSTLTAGLEGRFGQTWKWQGVWNRGESKHRMDQHGLYNWRNAYAAIDVVLDGNGNPACRLALSDDPVLRNRFADCRPLNIMGEGSALTTPDGYAYATGTSSYRADNTQDVLVFSFGGELFQMPAGPVDSAFGAEFRRQELRMTSNANPALLDTQAKRDDYFYGVRGVPGSALFFWVTNMGEADGQVNVKEAFTEFNLPLLRDTPGAQALDINIAARATDYSTSGLVKTWKIGSTWRPVDDLLLRATLSRDIRAPTLFNLFAGDQSRIQILADPVSGITENVTTITGGNRDLKPEEADTFSAGVVFSPAAFPGFTLAVDYYRLKIDGAIATLEPIPIVQNCFASGGSAPECALIVRPSPDAFPSLIRNAPANIAFLETAGVDIDATLNLDAGPGRLTLRLYSSWLDTYKTQQSSTAPIYEFAGIGQVGTGSMYSARPKWRGFLNVGYAIGNFNLALMEQYIGRFRLGSDEPNQVFEKNRFGSVMYTDLTASYQFPDSHGRWEMFLTVNNLFDREPPVIPGVTPGVGLPTLALYDSIGRVYTAGVRFNF